MGGENHGHKNEEESLLRRNEITYDTFSEHNLASSSSHTASRSRDSSQASSSKMMPIMRFENFDALHHNDLNTRSASDELTQYVKKDEKMPKVGIVKIRRSDHAKIENEEIIAQSLAAEKSLLRKIDLR